MRKLMLPLLCVMMGLTAGQALAATTPAQRAGAIAPFVDEQTVAVAYLDLSAVDMDALASEMQRAGLPIPQAALAASMLKAQLAQLTAAGAHDVYVVVSTAYLLYPPYLVVIPLGQGANADALAGGLKPVLPESAVIKGALCAGPVGVLAKFRALAPAARPELEAAFAAAGDAPLVAIFMPTADNRRAIDETLPVLPDNLGGGPSSIITRGVMWASVSLRFEDGPSVGIVVQSKDADAAQALAAWVPKLKSAVLAPVNANKQVPPEFVAGTLDLLNPKVEGDRVVSNLSGDQGRSWLRGLVSAMKPKEPAAKP